MKTFFCNRTVDKSEMKRLIKWVLLNYGTQKATRFVDHLKTLGFHSATTAGISLGIDDLRIPPIKSVFLANAEKDILDNDLRYARGQITAVERLEKALDIWNTTNDTLKNEVIAHFRKTDIFNPVYMMAFSGARGNISQVRQLVGMRGLMADQQGQILDFPIRRNFREGLTVTEYMISCYGARKGLVDTALRTANSGYLTRRLVDVAQSVIIQQFDCGTTQGLEVVPSKQHECANIIGRVLAQPLINEQTGKYVARKNTEISPALATQVVHFPKIVVRSPLTCRLNAVCQLCYGWDLSKHKLVQLGEAVGVLAAQSIGEPGTQLTMRTFHTGGVFAGEATEKVYAPSSGVISYSGVPRGRKVMSRYGEPAFLTVLPVAIKIQRTDHAHSVLLHFPAFTLLFVSPGQHVMFHQSVAELSRVDIDTQLATSTKDMTVGEKELLAPDEGQIYFDNVKVYVPKVPSIRKPKAKAGDEDEEEPPFYCFPENTPGYLESLCNKKAETRRNRVFGYGFIWVLSGKHLHNNRSYPGDYFHQGFQPFAFTSRDVSRSPMSPLSSTPERLCLSSGYTTAARKLLTYQSFLHARQLEPFALVRTAWRQEKNDLSYIDTFCALLPQTPKPRAVTVTSYAYTSPQHRFWLPSNPSRRPLESALMCVRRLSRSYDCLTSEGRGTHMTVHPRTLLCQMPGYLTVSDRSQQTSFRPACLVGCARLVTVTTRTLTRWVPLSRPRHGKALFRSAGKHTFFRQSTFSDASFSDKHVHDVRVMPTQDMDIPVVLATCQKHWTHMCQMLPSMEVHRCYATQDTFWHLARVRGLFPSPWGMMPQRALLPTRLPPFIYESVVGTRAWSSDTYAVPTRRISHRLFAGSDALANCLYSFEGEIRLPELALTKSNQHVFARKGKKCVVPVGTYIRVGDALMEDTQSPYAGQLIHINATHIILRRVYPYAISHGSSLFVNHGDFIEKNMPFGTLVSLASTAGDIVQGLPKVDELLEAREPVEKILSSVHAQLATLFFTYSKLYGVREGCRRSLQEIRCLLVYEVQAVYGAQGVFISDKHIEIVVRQMTTHVLIIDPGDTNLLPGDMIDLRRVEHFARRVGAAPIQYRPILLGITRASLAAESFIAAASFQETKRVLTRAAVEGRIDWLTGLKENVILGRLIPAGTGLYV
jgi:hypothetical protein